jgi:T5SS/PEP-CTERM-associated repeat protein
MRIHLLMATAVAAALLAATSPPRAETTNWTAGANSSDWFTAGNWSNGVPVAVTGTANINTVEPFPTVVATPGAQAFVVNIANGGVTGILTIENGGTLSASQNVTVGNTAASTGTLTIQSGGMLAGSINNTIGGFAAGATGTAIVNGGVWNGGSFTVGAFNAGNTGTATGSTGMITVEGGGRLTGNGITLGSGAGSTGTMIVTGAGSSASFTPSGTVQVGGNGVGTLTIEDGGAVTNAIGNVGSTGSSAQRSVGTATVTGPGSTWTMTNGLGVSSRLGSTLTIEDGGTVTSLLGTVGGGFTSPLAPRGTVIVTGMNSTWTVTGVASGQGIILGGAAGTQNGTGTLTVADGGMVSSGVPISVAPAASSTGTLNIGAAPGDPLAAPGTLNTPAVTFGAGTGTINFNHTATDYVFAPTISGPGTVNVLAGTTHLTADNTYTGPTNVNGGALFVDGSLTNSSVTVNGGTLAGIGTVVNNVQVNSGGTFAPGSGAPGSSMTVGSLAFASGAQYMVFLDASTSSLANVTGTASLTGGTVVPNVLSVSHKTYLILHSAGLNGTTFNGISDPNFLGELSYSATDVFLTLTEAELGHGTTRTTLNVNQQNVANAIDNFFNSGGTLPPAFGAIFGLTGSNLTNALDQVSGEAATGAQQAAFQLAASF